MASLTDPLSSSSAVCGPLYGFLNTFAIVVVGGGRAAVCFLNISAVVVVSGVGPLYGFLHGSAVVAIIGVRTAVRLS